MNKFNIGESVICLTGDATVPRIRLDAEAPLPNQIEATYGREATVQSIIKHKNKTTSYLLKFTKSSLWVDETEIEKFSNDRAKRVLNTIKVLYGDSNEKE